jgi:hypothetical protein
VLPPVGHLWEEVAFSLEDHQKVWNKSIKMQHLQNTAKNEARVTTILANALPDTQQKIKRGQDTGMMLSVSPTTVNGTELSAQEFQDAFLVHFDKMPTDLPTHCEGYYKPFNLSHILECKKGGLVICRQHNKIKDNLVALAAKAFTPSAVCNKPPINPSCYLLTRPPMQWRRIQTLSSYLHIIPRKQTGVTSLSMDSGNKAPTAS